MQYILNQKYMFFPSYKAELGIEIVNVILIPV